MCKHHRGLASNPITLLCSAASRPVLNTPAGFCPTEASPTTGTRHAHAAPRPGQGARRRRPRHGGRPRGGRAWRASTMRANEALVRNTSSSDSALPSSVCGVSAVAASAQPRCCASRLYATSSAENSVVSRHGCAAARARARQARDRRGTGGWGIGDTDCARTRRRRARRARPRLRQCIRQREHRHDCRRCPHAGPSAQQSRWDAARAAGAASRSSPHQEHGRDGRVLCTCAGGCILAPQTRVQGFTQPLQPSVGEKHTSALPPGNMHEPCRV